MKEPKSLKEVKTLGRELLSSRAHVNNLPILLRCLSPHNPPAFIVESLLSLHSFFAPIITSLSPASSQSYDNNAQLIYNTWLRSKFEVLLSSLFGLLFSPDTEDAIRDIVFDSMMEFVKLGNKLKFQSAIFHKLVLNLVMSDSSADFLLDSLASRYFEYIDVRYFTYISVRKIAQNVERDSLDQKNINNIVHEDACSAERKDNFFRRMYFILSKIPAVDNLNGDVAHKLWSSGLPEVDKVKLVMENPDVIACATYAKRMKLKFTRAWISFLRLPLPIDVYKEVLVNLHHLVIPHFSNPKILCDFLTKSYDVGGVVSIMALSSLFILMTEHGLEYPGFYEKLYVLLMPSIFLAKHRAKFFELMDACLKSPLLPAYLAAAFAKKLSRLSLSIPPSGALVITGLIHNLIRRHPSINCLIHRDESVGDVKIIKISKNENSEHSDHSVVGTEEVKKPGIDHFNIMETNPEKSNAMRSSLWEIDTLRHHYCPDVSRFVLSLERDLTVRSKTSEIAIADFSSASYATIFGNEMRRRVKQVPVAFCKTTPTCLFWENQNDGWTFVSDDEGGNSKRHRSE